MPHTPDTTASMAQAPLGQNTRDLCNRGHVSATLEEKEKTTRICAASKLRYRRAGNYSGALNFKHKKRIKKDNFLLYKRNFFFQILGFFKFRLFFKKVP
jgi:hypothetical protein